MLLAEGGLGGLPVRLLHVLGAHAVGVQVVVVPRRHQLHKVVKERGVRLQHTRRQRVPRRRILRRADHPGGRCRHQLHDATRGEGRGSSGGGGLAGLPAPLLLWLLGQQAAGGGTATAG